MTAKHVVAWKWAKENKDAKKGLLLEFISSLTLSTATTGISASTVFTSDLFCIPWTSCSFGPGKQDDWAICSSQNSSTYPHHCFSALQFWGRERERERYVLILRSFQEKYIPERSFHVCHIMEEKVSPCRPGRQPALPTKQLGHVHVA